MAEKKSINLKIHGRNGLLFSGPVSSLSAQNTVGTFDILSEHANFISLITERVTYRDAITNVPHVAPIGRAILTVVENEVNIYLGM